jgi:hypothetical protein
MRFGLSHRHELDFCQGCSIKRTVSNALFVITERSMRRVRSASDFIGVGTFRRVKRVAQQLT